MKDGIKVASWLWQILQYFALPALVGLAVVKLDQSELFYAVCKKLKLRLTHHIPTAWDYAFSKIVKGTFILVKLNDGTQYAGVMGKDSFASTNRDERDIYMEEVWSVEPGAPWKRVEPRRSVLLCGKDVRWVEIFYRS